MELQVGFRSTCLVAKWAGPNGESRLMAMTAALAELSDLTAAVVRSKALLEAVGCEARS